MKKDISPVVRHGYYISAQNLLVGDNELALQSKEIFQSFGVNEKFSQRYDGVSINVREDGTITKRVSIQNFFDPKFNVLVFDLPS